MDISEYIMVYVIELALAQLTIEGSNKNIFQRRDSKAPTSPHRLGWFGGHIDKNEEPLCAIRRELGEETSLDIGRLAFTDPEVYNVPAEHSSDRELVRVHLFSTALRATDTDFKVFEGTGSEIYTNNELLARNDVAATVRYVLEHTAR